MKKIFWIWFFLSIFFLYWCTTNTWNEAPVLDIAKLAQCMWDKWVKMYGTETCSHCIDQKEMFGENFKYIKYVDCAQTPDTCSKIEWTPTWEFPNWELLPGKQQLSVLAEKSGCVND